MTEAHLPQWSKQRRPPTSHLPEVDLVLPGPSIPPPRSAHACAADPAPPLPSPQLLAVLSAAGAPQYARVFAAEQLLPADVARLDFVSLRAIFPNVPAKLLLRIHHLASTLEPGTAPAPESAEEAGRHF